MTKGRGWKRNPRNVRRRESFSRGDNSTGERKSEARVWMLRGRDWWKGTRARCGDAGGRDGDAWASWPRSFQEPSVPRFNFLRGLISPSFRSRHQAKVRTPPKSGASREGFWLRRDPPQCRLSRSVKSRHPRLKKLIRYPAVLAPQSHGDWKGQCRETKYEIRRREKGFVSMRKGEGEKERKGQNSRSKKWDGKGTSEKTRRDGPAVIISDNHPEKLRGTSFLPHPPIVSSVFHQDTNKNALSNPSSLDATLIFSTRWCSLYRLSGERHHCGIFQILAARI